MIELGGNRSECAMSRGVETRPCGAGEVSVTRMVWVVMAVSSIGAVAFG